MNVNDVWTVFGWLFLTGCVFLMIGLALLPLLDRACDADIERERQQRELEAKRREEARK